MSLAFPYEDLWYIKLINETDKNPLETWGGYSQDFEAADTVYSHEQVLDSTHENWGVVGIRGEDRYLLIFDLDIHKAPADFDPDSITIPNETAIVRSQNGGLHVYVVVDADGEGKEADFEMAYDLGWDIDIRGSYVKHHVVAPADIPGVGGRYDIVNDESLLTVYNPTDAADRIRYLGDCESDKPHGEPLLKHSPAGGFGGHVDIDRNVEPPEEMPACYHRGLQVRQANPEDPNVNTHKVNTLTALCGLAAGYSIDDMIEHFCTDFPPGMNADTDETRYQLEQMAAKMDRDSLAPPSITTLRDYGILDDGETCECSIAYHNGTPSAADRREELREMEHTTDMRDVFDAIECVDAAAVARDPETPVDECDALQVVALETGHIADASEYPSGQAFWRSVDALCDRGVHIPRFVDEDDYETIANNTADQGGLDEETILTLSGPLALRSTRRGYTPECPACGAAVTDDHAPDCTLSNVTMRNINNAYQTIIELLDDRNRSLATLRTDASGWGPVHARVVEYLHDEDAIAPAGREVLA